MKYLQLIIIILTTFTSSLIAQEEKKVAVFDPVANVDNAIIEIVREEISSVIVNSKGYVALERQLINKVLEENKFQGSGLVGESQVSEIGKVMGADYVFVTTISNISTNYYISCKLVEVATAHIEMQSTGTTKQGTSDLTTTIQTIVSSMLTTKTLPVQKNEKAETVKKKEKKDKEKANEKTELDSVASPYIDEIYSVTTDSKTEQKVETLSQPVTATVTDDSDFTSRGGAVFSNGKKIEKAQLLSLLDNSPDIKKRYISGMKKRSTGTGLIIAGVALPGIGGGIGCLVKSEKIERDGNNIMQRTYNNWKTFALVGAAAGIGIITWGICLNSAGNDEMRRSINAFSSERKKTQSEPSLKLELKTDGVGLSYNF
jgi:Curli production assembly/transport component CsgG.